VRRFAGLCGSTIPPDVEKELSQVENDEEGALRYGIELATRMCGELLKSGVPGLHFYALNRSRSTVEILSNLGLAP
jgi:methylenetetrahydrofolate reductase (NADPH)